MANISGLIEINQDKIILQDVPIVAPAGGIGAERGGEELIKSLDLTVELGQHTLITGPKYVIDKDCAYWSQRGRQDIYRSNHRRVMADLVGSPRETSVRGDRCLLPPSETVSLHWESERPVGPMLSPQTELTSHTGSYSELHMHKSVLMTVHTRVLR